MKTTKDYLEAFDEKFVQITYPFLGGQHNYWKEKDDMKNIDVIKQFLSDTIKETYNAGYKQGVEDEIKCVETSGEHLNLQEIREMMTK